MRSLLARVDDFFFHKFKAHHINQQERVAQTFDVTTARTLAQTLAMTNDELLEHYNYLITEMSEIKNLLNDLIKYVIPPVDEVAPTTITIAAPAPSRDAIMAWLIEHIDTEYDLKDLKENWTFTHDLGMDSLDLTALLLTVEDHFDIQITNESAVQVETIGQAIDVIIATIAATDTKTPSA